MSMMMQLRQIYSLLKNKPIQAKAVTVDASGGVINWDGMAISGATYNGDGTIATLTKTDGVDSWKVTYTYTGGNLTGTTLPTKL